MRNILFAIIIFTFLILSGCQSQSHLVFPVKNLPGVQDSNTTIELWGKAADTVAQQLADNLKTEAGRLADLFKYNSILFLILFATMLGGVIFAILTRSSWGWVIPSVAAGGLLSLVFIVQAAVYIKWIILGIVVVALGVLVFKTWQYQKERNKETAKLKEVKSV